MFVRMWAVMMTVIRVVDRVKKHLERGSYKVHQPGDFLSSMSLL